MGIVIDFVDIPHDNVWSVELTTKDEVLVNDVWYREDQLLVELSHQEPFLGKTKWCDLEMIHYQLLLYKAFDLLDPQTKVTTFNVEHREPFLTFSFLASAIVKMCHINGISGFDRVMISRPVESRITVDFRKTFRFDWDQYVPPAPPEKIDKAAKVNPFRVVVDNSK